MNCRIDDFKVRAVCRELLGASERSSYRKLREVLLHRYGATGKTARLLKIWREELDRHNALNRDRSDDHPQLPTDVQDLQHQLAQARSRAELAELREQSHQDRWALEIDQLRGQLRAQPDYAQEVRRLRTTVGRLTSELATLRATMDVGNQTTNLDFAAADLVALDEGGSR